MHSRSIVCSKKMLITSETDILSPPFFLSSLKYGILLEAMKAGLISRLVDDDKVHEETIKVAEKIASMSRAVIALGKNFFYTQVQLPVVDAYRLYVFLALFHHALS